MRIFGNPLVLISLATALGACSAGSGRSGPESSSGGGASSGGASSTGSGSSVSSGGSTYFASDAAPSTGCSDQAVTVLFVIDRSGSMNCNLPPITTSADCEAMSPPAKVDSTQPSKWEVMEQTLSAALDKLVPSDPTVQVRAGLMYFSVDGVCGTNPDPEVAVADATPAQLDLIRQSVAAKKPFGGTPLVGGVVQAYNHLYQALQVSGNAHVIVLTDGADSCASYYAANVGPGDQVDALISNYAPTALGFGIDTWVIGAPGSEPARSMLSRLAVAGGTRRSPDCTAGTSASPMTGDCHYDMTQGDFQTGLQIALEHIMSVVTCESIH